MKKTILMMLFIVFGLSMASAQNQAEIKFDKMTIDLGTFSEANPVQKATFTFTNIGKAPLVINQVVASCGCTVPRYDKRPIAPGQKGSIDITYNGKGQFPQHIKKSITVRTNGKNEITRLYIEGIMESK